MISLKEIHIKIILVQFEGSNITFALPEFPLIKTLIPIFEQKLIVSDLSVLGPEEFVTDSCDPCITLTWRPGHQMQGGSGKQTQTHGCEPPYLGAGVGADQDMQFQLYSRNE